MIEIVPPLYLAMSCLFVGLTLAAMPARDSRLPPDERMGLYGVYGGVTAALACVCIALAPLLGRTLLVFSTLFLWASFFALGLRVRSWHRPPSPPFVRNCALAMGLVMLIMLVQFFTVKNRDFRVLYQLVVSVTMLVWMLYGLRQTSRLSPSPQLSLMSAGVLAMIMVIVIWSWTLLSGNAGRRLYFSELFSEESLAFSMRLFMVAALALMLISANGYGLERLVTLKSKLNDQKDQTDQRNEQLKQLLKEKNEMLQALSYSVRSENLPAIMSSLSHEINQPLGAMRLTADYLQAEDARLIPLERAQLVQKLVVSSITATEVLRDFRRFLETSQTPHVPVKLQPLQADVVRAFQVEFKRREVQFDSVAPEAVAVMGDPVQLESALSAVLRFMLKRSSKPGRHMQISSKLHGGFVHVHLLDDGPRLTAHEFERALDRGNDDTLHQFSQSLWLSRAIIEHHGGAIHVHEEDGLTGIGLQLPILQEKAL